MDHSMIFEPSWWARLFRQIGFEYSRAELLPTGVSLQTSSATKILHYHQFNDVAVKEGVFWGELLLTTSSGKRLVLGGIPKDQTSHLRDQILSRQSTFLKAVGLLKERRIEIESLALGIVALLNGDRWTAHHEFQSRMERIHALSPVLNIDLGHLKLPLSLRQALETLRDVDKNREPTRQAANQRFLAAELDRYREYFETVEANPLTDSQRRAVIAHEDNTRVIAGAGSGKTSVIVAKAGYLIKKGLCKSSGLLLVAFGRDAADEMNARIRERLGIEVCATTFHALGLGIIGEVEKKKPSLSKSADDTKALKRQAEQILAELIRDPTTSKDIRNYFQGYFAPYRSQFDFKELGDYYAYLKEYNLVTLEGEKVKSYEEVEIANFLSFNGIAYEYEKDYEHPTADITHRQYQPDFYLTDHGIYIEHFGIARDGSTPPFINQVEYQASINWKRELHDQHETRLIETYSYQKAEGALFTELEKKLNNAGVEFHPVTPEEVLEKLHKANRISPFTDLVTTFLNHFKGGCHTVEEVRERASSRNLLDARLDAFLTVFQRFLTRYESALKNERAIDFNDMITRAAEYVESGRYASPYTCILVDEFQDISTGRSRLIKALSNQNPNHRLFCVGDDWQAIYRFAGSDIALMRDFSQHFGFTETVALEHTFRFNDAIEAVATRFVLKNPAQIKKTVFTLRKASTPRVFIHRPGDKEEDILIAALEEIQVNTEPDAKRVLLLGRYGFLKKEINWAQLCFQFPGLEIKFKTVHGAKGLEADYVVVLGMQAGKYGFPSELTDDPVLDVVLSVPEGFRHAEERRLFYVALTRARHAVHLIADSDSPSAFLTEVMAYSGLVEARGAAAEETAYCPSCKTAPLTRRSGQHGVFYGCNHYPLCDYTVNTCSRCGTGVLVQDKSKQFYACNNINCSHTEHACPQCGTGRLVRRSGPYGPFLGCTNYAREMCGYTTSLAP